MEKSGFIRCPYNFAEDYYLAASIAANGFGNVYSDKVLACYRVWQDDGNVRLKRKLEEVRGLTSVFEEVIEPAYKIEKFDLHTVARARARFAKAQANCLSWKSYSTEEKEALQKALSVLSSAPDARFVFKLYRHNFHFVLNGINILKSRTKKLAKSFALRFVKT